MCVNDLACTGATPLVFLDYLAVGRLDPDEAAASSAVIAAACAVGRLRARSAARPPRCPGSYAPATSTWPGSPAAWSSATRCSGPTGSSRATRIVGIPSSGIHSNGFSLVRALVDGGALAPDPDLLLAPTRLYVRDLAAAARRPAWTCTRRPTSPAAGSPRTSRGRCPEGLRRRRSTPTRGSAGPAIAAILATGRVAEDEAWRTFNMGLGMCLVVPEADAASAVALIDGARDVGRVEPGRRACAVAERSSASWCSCRAAGPTSRA